MLRPGILFVTGAALSAELGLPMGNRLKQQIVQLLPERRGSGDDLVLRFAETNRLMPACYTLRNALPLAASIDNLIEHRSDNEGVVQIAKFAIARAISKAEMESSIGGRHSGLQSLPAAGSHAALFRLIVNGVPKPDLDEAFSRLRIITFNYDRTFEVFLLRALMAYAHLSTDEARSVLSHATIVHAYGALGATALGTSMSVTEFALDFSLHELINDAAGLRTFSEKIDDGSDQKLRDLVQNSQDLVFLGCAYHPQNLRLLAASTDQLASVAGTAYLPPPPDPDGHAKPSMESFAGPIQDSLKSAISGWPRSNVVPLLGSCRFDVLPLTSLQLITFLGSRWTA